MTVAEVKTRVERVRSLSQTESNIATANEVNLWGDVLQAIAQGDPNARELAIEALRTGDIEFPRWMQ